MLIQLKSFKYCKWEPQQDSQDPASVWPPKIPQHSYLHVPEPSVDDIDSEHLADDVLMCSEG